MKLFKRILIICTGALVLLLASLFTVAYLFEDEIIEQAIAAINESVDTKIDVAQVDFSLIHDFPNASLLFYDVTIEDKIEADQNLLFAEMVSMEFDILNLIAKEYSINRIEVNRGTLKMRTRLDGEVNFIFWKASNSQEDLRFDVQKIILSEIEYSYADEPADIFLSSNIEYAILNGSLSNDWVELEAELVGINTNLKVEESNYLFDNEINFDGGIRINEKGTDIYFTDSRIDVGPVEIPISGRVFKVEAWAVDLVLEGKADLKEFLDQLPEDQKAGLDDYAISGRSTYSMTIKGESNGSTHPEVQMEFALSDGSCRMSKGGAKLNGINAKGHYQRSMKGIDAIEFESFNASVPQGDISFIGTLVNFDRPNVKGKLTCESELNELLALSDQNSVMNARGQVHLLVDVDGDIPSKEDLSFSSVRQMNIFGTAEFIDVAFLLNGNGYRFQNLNTKMILKDEDVLLDDASLIVNGDPININGKINGILEYLISEKGKLNIQAKLVCENLNWDNWASAAEPSEGRATELSQNINLDITFQAEEFAFRKFRATELGGILSSSGQFVTVRPLSFKTCKGQVNSEFQLRQFPDMSWSITSDGSISRVDVSKLFEQFENFGQEFLTPGHLKGTGDAHITFSADMDSTMNIDKNSINVYADLTILDGELIQHPSMIGIIEELRERHLLKPFVRADELEQELRHLKFQRLHNMIKIHDGVIHIPQMEIANNALDIGIKGSHGFDQVIEYTVDFTLRDILVNKQNPEFLIQDDGLGHRIHLSLGGTVSDPVIELDKEVAKENRKEAIAEAKEDIREFFKDPFKKKDKEKDDRAAVIVEMDEPGKDAKASEGKDPKKTKKQWWKVEEQDEGEVEAPIEDEDDF